MKIKHRIPMWIEVNGNTIYLLTENPYKNAESCILHTEPNTTEGMNAMKNFIAENFASAQIIED